MTHATMQSRTATFAGAGVIDIRAAEIGPRPEELVRVRVDLCALCGSDKRLLNAGAAVTPGHEIAGTVVEVPASESSIDVGQRVLVYIPLYCGACAHCEAGQTNRCSEMTGLIGWQTPGGFQEWVDVPARNLIPIPDDVSSHVALLALDTVGTAAHGIEMCLQALGETPTRAAVIGCGPLGLGAIASLRALGVEEVYATDPAPSRLAAAVGMGAVALAEKPPGRAYPLVVEAAGASAARALALEVVRAGGSVLLLGEGSDEVRMPATPSWRRTDAFYVRSFYFPLTQVPSNFAMLRKFGADLADRLCSVHPLRDLQTVFERFAAGELIKPVIDVSQKEGYC